MHLFITIVFLGILVALHELGHLLAARLTGMKVLKYSIGFFKPIFSFTSKTSGITWQLGAVPLGGFVQVKGMNPFEEGAFEDEDSYQRKAPWKRALVVAAGPVANLVLAWLILFLVAALSGLPSPVNKAGVGVVSKGSPAMKAGLQNGDRILQINGKDVATWEDMVSVIQQFPDQKILLLVSRGERRLPVEVVPANVDGVGKIGVGIPSEMVSLPPGKAAVHAATKCAGIIVMTLEGLGQLVTGKAKNVEVAGPPKIVQQASAELDSGPAYFLAFMSFISVLLFLFNLLPIPALDGGRILFLFYELVTRRPVNRRFDAIVNHVFFFLLLGLIAVISLKELIFSVRP